MFAQLRILRTHGAENASGIIPDRTITLLVLKAPVTRHHAVSRWTMCASGHSFRADNSEDIPRSTNASTIHVDFGFCRSSTPLRQRSDAHITVTLCPRGSAQQGRRGHSAICGLPGESAGVAYRSNYKRPPRQSTRERSWAEGCGQRGTLRRTELHLTRIAVDPMIREQSR